MTAKEILIAAKAKIQDPANWTQGTYSRGSDGSAPCAPCEEVCWCVTGAVSSVCALYKEQDGVLRLLDKLSGVPSDSSGLRPIAKFNDTHTHLEVLAILDLAIAEVQ